MSLGRPASKSENSEMASQVSQATRALAAAEQQDLIWGHASARDPEGRGMWMKCSGVGFDEIASDRVILVSWDGKVLAGDGPRHVEWPIHAAILRDRPDVNWVVHTHPTSVNVFTSLDVPLRAVSHDAVLFCEPQLPRFADGELITTADRGRLLAVTLGGHRGCYLPAHGIVCVGSSAGEAVMHTFLLTRACAAMVQAVAAGGPAVFSSAEEVAAKRSSIWPAGQLEAGYQYLVRKARTEV